VRDFHAEQSVKRARIGKEGFVSGHGFSHADGPPKK
jgi:hypothetical protein